MRKRIKTCIFSHRPAFAWLHARAPTPTTGVYTRARVLSVRGFKLPCDRRDGPFCRARGTDDPPPPLQNESDKRFPLPIHVRSPYRKRLLLWIKSHNQKVEQYR